MNRSDARVSTLWIMLLTLASALTTLALACATPFTALAALAATQLRARDGIVLMIASWALSQATGFCLLGYPRDASTLLWGATLGLAAIAAVVGARVAADRVAPARVLLRIAVAYLGATIGFKIVQLLGAIGLGGVDIALSPAINARLFARNAAILAGLYLLYRTLVAAGLPAAPRERPVAAC